MCPHTTNNNEEQARLAHYKSLVAHSNLKQALHSFLLLLFSCYICPYAATCVIELLSRPRKSQRGTLLQDMCAHTTTYTTIYMCPHTATYVSSYSYMCVHILLHMSPTALADGGLVMSSEVVFKLFRAALCCRVSIIQVGVCVCVCVWCMALCVVCMI